jgi:hypothetical protein
MKIPSDQAHDPYLTVPNRTLTMLAMAWGAMMMAGLVRLARCAISVRLRNHGETPKTREQEQHRFSKVSTTALTKRPT